MQSLLVPDGRRPEVASWDKEPEQSGRVSRIDPKIKKIMPTGNKKRGWE